MDAAAVATMVNSQGQNGQRKMLEERVCLGVITAPHGIRGEVRIKCFTEDPRAVAAYGSVGNEAGDRHFELQIVGLIKGGVRARIQGCDDRDQAEALRGIKLFVARSALPEPDPDEYYYADLEGLAVERSDSTTIGSVVAIYDFGGSSDLLEISRGGRESFMVPFTREAVPTIDIAGGRIVVDETLYPEACDEGAEGAAETES